MSARFVRGRWVKCDRETTPAMADQIAQIVRVIHHLSARLTALESMHNNNPSAAEQPAPCRRKPSVRNTAD